MLRSLLTGLLRGILQVFFRRLQIVGREHIPVAGPVIFALNHPNALVDASVLLVHAGRPVSFLAKEPLFRIPVLGALVRALQSIPVWRRMDAADTTRNRATFAAARSLLAQGGSLALFPEGTSHSETRLKPFRTGAARIALGVADVEGLDLVPAGLFYSEKTRFRSQALLCFGPPIRVTPVELDAAGEPPAVAVRALTAALEKALARLTLQADHHEALALAALAERLLLTAAERRADLADRVELRRRLVAGYGRLREANPARLDALRTALTRYEATLTQAGLTPEFLPASGYRPAAVARVTLTALARLLVLLPLATVGIVLHAPAWWLVSWIAHRYRRTPDVVATVKAIAGFLCYSLLWIALGVMAGLRWGWPAGVLVVLAAPLTGYAALRFLERLDRLAGGARGLLLALTGRRKFLRLLATRTALVEELVAVGRQYGL